MLAIVVLERAGFGPMAIYAGAHEVNYILLLGCKTEPCSEELCGELLGGRCEVINVAMQEELT